MSHITKLFPVNQLLELFDLHDKKLINLKGDERILLIALAKFADAKWRCFPSIKRLANLISKDPKQVNDLLKRLSQKKIIKIKERYTKCGDRDSNQYTILVDNLGGVGVNLPPPRGESTPTVGVNLPPRGGESTPLTIQLTNHLTNQLTKSFSENAKKHDFADSMNQMAREKKQIEAHEAIKKTSMPDNLRSLIKNIRS